MYTDKLKIKIDKDTNKVTFSIRVTEEKVESYLIDLDQFRKMVGDFVVQDDQF